MVSILFCLLNAWVIGIAIAAPVGPIGMLCIRKTLEFGLKGAVFVGLGAALADCCYGLVAALGFSAITHLLLQKVTMLKIVGGTLLLFLALKELKSSESTTSVSVTSKTSYRLVLEIFFLTLTNPLTILSFISIFASIAGKSISPWHSLFMVLGIFLGSMTWWLFLGEIIVRTKHRLPTVWLGRIKYFSAFVLTGFGFYSIGNALMETL